MQIQYIHVGTPSGCSAAGGIVIVAAFDPRGRALDPRNNTKPGFHPDDTDNTALLACWTAALFDEQGSLVDHLH